MKSTQTRRKVRGTALISLIALFLLVMNIDLIAQEASPIVPGTRVRVTAPDVASGKIAGTIIITVKADTLELKVKGKIRPLVIPLGSITRLEVSRGRKSAAGWGAAIGFGIGAGWIAVLAATLPHEPAEASSAGEVARGIAVSGGIGAGLGALVGLAIRSDSWEEVPLDRVPVGVLPQCGRGSAFSVSFAF